MKPCTTHETEQDSVETRWHVYLLECRDGTFYCGITCDLERRIAQHNGLLPGGARYTRGRRPVRLSSSIDCPDKRTALRLERVVKARPRLEKHFMLKALDASKEDVPC